MLKRMFCTHFFGHMRYLDTSYARAFVLHFLLFSGKGAGANRAWQWRVWIFQVRQLATERLKILPESRGKRSVGDASGAVI
jgi:hypothetical protein